MSSTELRLQVLARHLQTDKAFSHNTLARQSCCVTDVSQLAGPLLQGQVAVITGSGQGLAAAAAELFALHGAKVVVTDIDADKAQQVAVRIRENGGEAHAICGDVTTDDFPERLATGTVKQFGRIDILLNSAGFHWGGMLHRLSKKRWDALLAVHCTAAFRMIQAVAPHMRDAAKKEMQSSDRASPRTIINVSSTVGLHGEVGQVNYSAAKAALIGLTKTVAKEWGPFNVRSNAIAYGWINTRLTQVGTALHLNNGLPDAHGTHFMDPHELHNHAEFLAHRPQIWHQDFYGC
ncbi:hypothetical protein WJX73_001956 [Symbiochloris irregularis]|uniref:Uncharacterized protein n=1 Tax=Symbiochloris irregularis TaxID=706552 RepID=A0AAW1PVM4_9CHLO